MSPGTGIPGTGALLRAASREDPRGVLREWLNEKAFGPVETSRLT